MLAPANGFATTDQSIEATPGSVMSPAISPWPAPIPFGGLPPAPGFPLNSLHPVLARLASEGAAAMKCPVDFFGLGMLGALSTAIGNSRRVLIWGGWFESAAIYAGIIAPPGSGKTPSLNKVLAYIDRVDQRLRGSRSQSVGWIPGERIGRVMTTNGSINGLRRMMKNNPRGVGWFPDELRRVMEICNQYNQGKSSPDWAFLLSTWSNNRDDNDLVNQEKAFNNDNPFLSIIGGITPSNIHMLSGSSSRADDDGDGFLDRFLISYPDRCPASKETWASIHSDTTRAWEKILQRLLATGPQRNGRPKVVKLSTSGRLTYEQFTERDAAEINSPDYDPSLRGIWAKHRAYYHRLALILACCDAAADGVESFEVTSDHAARAAVLIEDYFRPHVQRVLAHLKQRRPTEKEQHVWKNVVKAHDRSGEMVFTLREIVNRFRGRFNNEVEPTKQWLCPILASIARHRLIRSCPRDPNAGNRAGPRYEINPIALEATRCDPESSEENVLDARFDEFMAIYPRHTNRQGAKQMFLQIEPSDDTFDLMMAALRIDVRSNDWQRDQGRFVPTAEKWLRERRWEDRRSRTKADIRASRRAADAEIGPRKPTEEQIDQEERERINREWAKRVRDSRDHLPRKKG